MFAGQALERGTTADVIEAEYVGQIPLRRILGVEEIAGVVALLAGPSLGAITGQSITADAGYARGVYL